MGRGGGTIELREERIEGRKKGQCMLVGKTGKEKKKRMQGVCFKPLPC